MNWISSAGLAEEPGAVSSVVADRRVRVLTLVRLEVPGATGPADPPPGCYRPLVDSAGHPGLLGS